MSNEIQFPFSKISLNNQQYKIVTEENIKEKLVLSCAGSGKTLTIISKICYMITKLNCNPDEFIVCTFNRNAGEELKKRICGLIGMTDIVCGTFHSIGLKLLNKYDYLYIDSEYYIDETQIIFLNFLKSERSIKLKEKYKYIFVDELQDINEIQLEMIKEIHKSCNSLLLVGDDLQNIYSFRGSTNNIIKNINIHFPDIVIDKMIYNYRSSKEIVNLANEVQEKNTDCIYKKMISKYETGKKPEIHKFKNLSTEIKFLISSIIKDLKNGYKKKEIGILCRNNLPLFFIEEQLQMANIKNKILNSESIIGNSISLTTIHCAKGLEWKKVYLIGMNNSYFPNPRSDINEERRLFYVAVTRAKTELIMTFNDNDNCSDLILELSDELFLKDFNFLQLSSNIIPTNPVNNKINTVTNMIKSLSGQDYINLKNLNILKNIKYDKDIIYTNYQYPIWVKENDYYSDFGSFIDYLIRRMINDIITSKNNKTNGLRDRRAEEVIMSIFLKSYDYKFWLMNLKVFNSCFIYFNNNEKINKKVIKEICKKFQKSSDDSNVVRIINIIKIIAEKRKLFQVEIEDINITNKIYLPFSYQSIMEKSYLKFINKKNEWKKIIWDIFMVSKCHSIWGDRRKNLYIEISKKNILSLEEFYDDIYSFISTIITENTNVYCNPRLDNGIIFGDADLIINNEIMDFKTSYHENINIEYTLQLLIYTALARSKGIEINKISIYNPLCGVYYYADISKWDKDEELLDYLINKVKLNI
jgi:hypothetical protein